MIINNIENYNPQNFFEFLKEIERNIARNQNSNNNELKRLEYLVSHLNREEKRQTNYGKLKENIQRYEKKFIEMQDLINKIRKFYEDDEIESPLTDTNYQNFIALLALYNDFTDSDITLFSKEFIKPFIVNSKNERADIKFLNFFDDEGNLIPNFCYDVITYIENVYKTLKKENIINITEESFSNIIVSDEDIEIANRERRLKEEEERFKREELKKKLTEGKQKLANIHKQANIESTKEYKPDPIKKEISKYYDLNTCELKNGACLKITLEKLIEMIEPYLNKNKINRCIDDYNQQIRDTRFANLKSILGSNDHRKLEKILTNTDDDDISKIEFEDFIRSDTFNNLSGNDIRNKINNLINGMLQPKNNIENFIIFPSKELVSVEINNVYNSQTHANSDPIFKSMDTQLRTLQSNSISYLKSNLYEAFHVIQSETNTPLILDGKLKAYRFGHAKAKTSFFVLSVNENNLKILQQQYNIELSPKVLLVFGMSNVDIENEMSFYKRMVKYANDHQEQLLEIYNIFANPFTTETLHKALEYVDTGMNILDQFKLKTEEAKKAR